MDGKPNMKIISKLQLLSTFKLANSEPDIRYKTVKNFHMHNSVKRGSTPPTSSRSISIAKKNTNSVVTLSKLQVNNFMSTKNLKNPTKRIFQCQTAIGIGKRGFKKQDSIVKTQMQKMLLKHSDKIQKLLWSQLDEYLPPLILSADFIMDQDLFWETPQINPTIIKAWKFLHKHYYVIWIVRIMKGYKKLKDFTENNQLALNAVYYQKRQNKYTVDFMPLRKQLNKIYGSALTEIKIIKNIKLNTKDVYQYGSFLGKVPLMYDSRMKVCFIRTQQNAQGLQKVFDAFKNLNIRNQSKIIQLKCIKIFVHDYAISKLKQIQANRKIEKLQSYNTRIEDSYIDQEEAQKQVDDFRREIVQKMIKEKGRNFQYEGFSIHYFVGDIIKRNYSLLVESAIRRSQMNFSWKTAVQNQKSTQHIQLGINEYFYQYYM